MSLETAEVISAARALPLEARAKIVDNLVDSLYSEDGASNDPWKEIVERRVMAYRNGETTLVPIDAVIEKATAILKR
ncbi:MAG: addiction module protein [Blastocatellia bacterium]|nr:addiction module protein [Blastocatellia bacterium]